MIEGLRKHSLRKLIYYLRYTEFTALARIIYQKLIAPNRAFHSSTPDEKFCLFISGCPGDSYRYRCEHQAAQLSCLGFTSDICYDSQIKNDALIDSYQWLWLQRVFNIGKMQPIIERAHRFGKKIIFDIDDLVFDDGIVPYMRETGWMSKREVERVYQRAKGYREIMSRCDVITVPTYDLRNAVLKMFPGVRCIVTQNMLSDAQVVLANQPVRRVHRAHLKESETVKIAYFSGTHTHNIDFRECSKALVRVMETHPSVRLMLIGYLEIGEEFSRLNKRIEAHRLIPWEQLPELFTKVDINLAPLELDNCFTACKSDLKFTEAAMMGVPTVASAVGSFIKSIHDGENGYLCRSDNDWYNCLVRLVEDSELRQRMGNAAKQLVLKNRTVSSGAEYLKSTLLAPTTNLSPQS